MTRKSYTAICYFLLLALGVAHSAWAQTDPIDSVKLGALSQCYLDTQSLGHKTLRARALKKPIKLSLREAILLALRCNAGIVNAEFGRITQKFALTVAKNNFEWNLTLSGKSSASWSKANGVSSPTSKNFELTTGAVRKNKYGGAFTVGVTHKHDGSLYHPGATVSLTQPLLKGAGEDVTLKSLRDAYDTEETNKLGFLNTIITTTTTIIRDYRNLIRENNNLVTSQNSLRDALKLFKSNEARIKHGMLAPNVNITQQTTVDERRLTVERSHNSISQARQRLLQDIGLDPDLPIEVPKDVELDDLKAPPMQETIEYALDHNIAYVTRLINYRKSKRALLKAKDDLRWTLNASASATFGNGSGGGKNAGIQSIFNGRNNTKTIGLDLTVPIDDLSLQSAWLSARVTLETDKTNLAQAQRALITDVKNKVIDIRSQIAQVRMSERLVESARRSYSITVKMQQLGRASSNDVSTRSDKLLSSEQDLIRNKISYLTAVADLEAVLATTVDKWGIRVRY